MKSALRWFAKGAKRAGRVGVAVGPDGLRVAWLGADGELKDCASHPDMAECTAVLRAFVDRHDLEGTPCSVVLHPIYYQLLLADAPAVDSDDELQGAVRWAVRDLLDFPLDQAAIAAFRLPADAYRGRKQMVYSAALRKTVLDELVAPVEASGLAVDCVEVSELALHNLAGQQDVDGGYALMHLFDAEGFINLVDGGEIYLSRRVELGIDNLAGADAARQREQLLLELQRSLDFYESQLGKGIITQLFYSPVEPVTEQLGQFLSAQLGLNVAALSPFSGSVTVIDDSLPVQQCLTAIGAAHGPRATAKGEGN